MRNGSGGSTLKINDNKAQHLIFLLEHTEKHTELIKLFERIITKIRKILHLLKIV